MGAQKFKYLACGIAIGSMISFAAVANADYAKGVIARVASEVSFEFDGKKVPLPEGYTVLEYNGRTYVPARFVAEQLGGKVDWDERTNTVRITGKPAAEPQPSPKEEQKGQESSVNYVKLPLSTHFGDYRVSVESVFSDKNRTRIYVHLENESDKMIRIDNLNVSAEVDGKMYSSRDVPAGYDDARLYNDIGEDEEVSGYLALPPLPKDAKRMHLTFNILINGATVEKKQLDYYILLDVLDSGGR